MAAASFPRHHERPADSAFVEALRSAANGEYRYLLLLSHMRSFSSVLAHLLGSSPEIEGYGESQVRYRNVLDLWRLRKAIRQSTGEPLRGHWLLDKVLHNEVRPIDRFVGHQRLKVLIFLRRPERALPSLMNLARARGPGTQHADPQVACDYYVRRLHRLREDGQRYGDHALYFDAEQLHQCPADLLAGIGQWLGLHAPLSTHYRVGPRSGVEGFGDWLPNIRAGQLLGEEHSTVRDIVPVDPLVLAEAHGAYERCRTALMRSCCLLPAARTA